MECETAAIAVGNLNRVTELTILESGRMSTALETNEGQKQLMATVKLDHRGAEWGLKRERGGPRLAVPRAADFQRAESLRFAAAAEAQALGRVVDQGEVEMGQLPNRGGAEVVDAEHVAGHR